MPPLENDENVRGAPSDHLIVIMRPLSKFSQIAEKKYKMIHYRPFPDSGIRIMGTWLQSLSWQSIYNEKCPSKKADLFENILMKKIEEIFPMKSIRVNEKDKPWVDEKLKNIDRRRKREYNKNKKSDKWKSLNIEFLERAERLKLDYNKNVVEDLKSSNIGQWYSKLKRMSGVSKVRDEKITVEALSEIPTNQQSEIIADRFAEISNMYKPLEMKDIEIPHSANSKPIPLFEPHEIYHKIIKMKRKAANVAGDLPWKIIREFAAELSNPLCNIFNTATIEGIWPARWKHEYVTPVPKAYPPKTVDDLRKIAGTKNLSKIF